MSRSSDRIKVKQNNHGALRTWYFRHHEGVGPGLRHRQGAGGGGYTRYVDDEDEETDTK